MAKNAMNDATNTTHVEPSTKLHTNTDYDFSSEPILFKFSFLLLTVLDSCFWFVNWLTTFYN